MASFVLFMYGVTGIGVIIMITDAVVKKYKKDNGISDD